VSLRNTNDIAKKLIPRRIMILSITILMIMVASYSYTITTVGFISPSAVLPLRINSTDITDESGITKNSFKKNDFVRISVNVEMATAPLSSNSLSYRVIFTVIDNSSKPVYFDSVTGEISAGVSVIVDSIFQLPSDSSIGTYSIKTFVWSDWLPNGDALTPSVGTGYFMVS